MELLPQTKQSSLAKVDVIPDLPEADWNGYLKSKGNTLYYDARWEKPFSVYGLKLRRLAAVRGSDIVGVVPQIALKTWIFKSQLVSLPWFDAAGILADDPDVTDALIAASWKLCKSLNLPFIQFRQETESDISQYFRRDKVLMLLSLPSDPNELWEGLKPKVRNQVRKGENSGLKVLKGKREYLDQFYDVYSTNMRDLGSPPHSKQFFSAILDCFPEEARIYIVLLNDQETVGAGFLLANGKRLEIPWASSHRKHNALCVNHALYWQILKDACAEGFGTFCFGRSTIDSGTYNFKKQWGAEPAQLYWYFVAQDQLVAARASSEEGPDGAVGLASKLWQKIPVSLAKTLGPWLIKQVP